MVDSLVLKVVLEGAPVQLVLVDGRASGSAVPIVGHGVAPLFVFEKLFACICATVVLENCDGCSLNSCCAVSLASSTYRNDGEQIVVTNDRAR